MTAPELTIPVHPDHAAEVHADEAKSKELVLCGASFLHFLNYWHFKDQERGKQRKLNVHQLWPGQLELVGYMEEILWIYALKARKLGFTTLECAYDAWVLRFRDQNARVHLFSRREDAAIELLDAVKYGYDRLPPWMKLPEEPSKGGKRTTTELKLYAGEDDERLAKAYPANETTAVEASCTHGHVDEWARMGNPEKVWQAVEPTMAGSCHLITTGVGPANYTAKYWRDSLAEDTEHAAIFIDALQRVGRDETWLAAKRRSMTEEHFRQEYPMKWQDALYGGGKFTFRSGDVTIASEGPGPAAPVKGHRYVKSWDVGRHEDAAVCTVIDAHTTPNQVVEYIRLREVPYPVLQHEMERIHRLYPGITVIEANAAGEAVAENLDIPRRQMILFNTGPKSKPKIIEELQLALEGRTIQWSGRDWPQLSEEVRGYQVPDDNIVQDSVMALAIGNAHVGEVFRHAGGLGSIGTWG